ncbi:hypothetical protein LMTR3_07740 [Bradyrhizobium sp. LMTR 3]|nr:hypothetical protein LMTR3_07740 [Bradyrhizobium sp. LMTR 3]
MISIAGRSQPGIDICGSVRLSRPPQKEFAGGARRKVLCRFLVALSLFRKPLLKGFLVFDTAATLDHALLHSVRGRRERKQAISSPIEATNRAVMPVKLLTARARFPHKY